jgi:Co/Zn/Cd efflux system component
MSCCCSAPPANDGYRRGLWLAFAVNLTMFAIEIVSSYRAESVSLRADALDFLGDAANYAVALLVLGRALSWRACVALLKGDAMGLFGLSVAGSMILSLCA